MKREAEGQRAWRASVSAFRAVAATLARPAPEAFSLLAEDAAVARLTAEPPLMHFSPFSVLPPVDYATGGEAPKENGGGAAPRPDPPERQPKLGPESRATPGIQPPTPPAGRLESSPAAPEARQRSVAHPVFPLQTRRPPDARHEDADVLPRQRRASPLSEAKQGRGHAPRADGPATQRAVGVARNLNATAPPVAAPEVATTAEKPEAPRPILIAEPPREHEGRETDSHHPTALPLLNDLADETLRSIRRREAGPSPAADSPAATRQVVNHQHRPQAVSRPAMTHQAAVQQATAPPSAATTAAPTREGAPASGHPVKGRAPLRYDDARTTGIIGTSIDAINALAELLLARSSSPASPPREPGTAAEALAPARPQPAEDLFSSHVSTPDAKPGPAGEDAAARAAAQPGQLAEGEASPRQPLDAESVASLVNEALVEQARRHGVDLS